MAHSSSKKTSTAGAGCLMLFALPFAGVGVFMAGWIVLTVVQYVQVIRWPEVPCTILEAELVTHSDSDGSTYEATARYTYQVDEKRYESTRVSLHSGADNIGSFQQEAHETLQRHQRDGRPFPGYYNPNEPSKSILFRDLRWGLLGLKTLFALVFGGAGFGILVGAIVSGRKTTHRKQQSAVHPSEPWLWKEEWASGQIKSSTKTTMWVLLAIAIFWNLVSMPLLFVLPGEIFDKKNYLATIGLLFPLVGMILVASAAWAVLRWRKYGESLFEMATTPGVLGGSLAGVIRSNKSLDAREGFRLALSCIEKRTTGSGKHRSTSKTTLWQDERTILRPLSAPGEPTAVPVAFAVPLDMPASTIDGGRHEIIWQLQISAAVPGIDYRAAFDVPVFKTEDSRPDFQLDESLIQQYAAQQDPEQEFRRTGVVRLPAPAGWGDRYSFPMLRNPGAVIGIGVFWLIWTGVCIGLWFSDAPLLFPIVFGLFDLLLTIGLLDVAFYRSVADVAPDGINVRGGLFGVGKLRRIDASQLAGLEPKRGMQQGSRVYYGLAAVTKDGRKITLGKRLVNRRAVEVVIDNMQQSMQSSP